MKKLTFFIISLLFILGFVNSIFAQGDVTVRLDVYLPDGGVMHLSDLGLTDIKHAPLLFSLTIENSSPIVKRVILKFGIRRGEEILLEGTTRPFEVPAASGSSGRIYLTNQNIFDEGTNYSLQEVDVTDASERLKDAILSTGKLPSGAYTFYAALLDEAEQSMFDEDSYTLNLSTPTFLDLVSPGAPVNSGEIPEIYTKMPFFQWDSDASKFQITVCEKLSENTDPQDVMRNEPRLQKTVENQLFYQYPPDAWDLEEGKTYYWQIVALIPSPAGEIRLESEIWGFRIANTSQGSNSAEHQQLMVILQSMFDSQNFAGLFGEGGPLEGFQFTGSAIFNGQIISAQNLRQLLNELLQGNIEIKSFAVE